MKVWFEDEARLGQQGTLTRVWARRGTRPTAIRQTDYKNLYVLTAVCPAEGRAEGMISPSLNTEVVNLFLGQIELNLSPKEHAVLILDKAGYHRAKRLRKSKAITPIYLPPYSPELNPVEQFWRYLRDHYWSNRVYLDYRCLEEAALESWKKTSKRFAELIAYEIFNWKPYKIQSRYRPHRQLFPLGKSKQTVF